MFSTTNPPAQQLRAEEEIDAHSEEEHHHAPALERPIKLEKVEDYRLWSVRTKAKLAKADHWDDANDLPFDNPATAAFMVDSISDLFLEQVLDSDMQASTIWTHLTESILKGGVSAQATALLNLINFAYQGPSMQANKTLVLGLSRALRTAFNDADSIPVADLVTLFALVNMPSEHQALRTTLEETKKEGITLAHLFEALAREEASSASGPSRASRVATNPGNSPQCSHNRDGATCWSCHPELAPTCDLCKKAGLSKFRHPPNCFSCKKQRKEIASAKAAAVIKD